MPDSPRRIASEQLVIGLGLVVLGVLLLLDQLGVAGVGEVLGELWPLALVAIGAIGVAQTRGRSVGPYIPLVLGVGFLLANLEVIPSDWLRYAWPLVPIIIGLWMLVNARGHVHGEDTQRVNITAMLGGQERRVTSQAFAGGELTAVMGGVDLDLSQARPVEGGATLRVFTLMGGADIVVPATWRVELRGFPLMGGFSDDRRNPPPPHDGRDLVIVGTVIMGGFEVTAAKETGVAPGAAGVA
jgi:predicted membrane protein